MGEAVETYSHQSIVSCIRIRKKIHYKRNIQWQTRFEFTFLCMHNSIKVQNDSNSCKNLDKVRHFFLHCAQTVSPPPMTTASYSDFGAAWLELHLLADAKTAAHLCARVPRTTAAAMTRGCAASRRLRFSQGRVSESLRAQSVTEITRGVYACVTVTVLHLRPTP